MKKVILLIISVLFAGAGPLCAESKANFAGAGSLRAESDAQNNAGNNAQAVAQEGQPTNIGVPSECEDVMLQAFYWDSYKNQSGTDSKYGRTKWIDLLKDTAAINANFDLVWFPPSAKSTGGVGYYHTCLSDQNGDWGTRPKLNELIEALHKGQTKVIGDIVINHRGNKSGWTDFYQDNFGQYGTYQLTQSHICSGDEAFTSSNSPVKGSATHGAADTGTNDGGCRDLDHTSEYVQNWAKAYVQWMIDVMQYDGFRYDMTRGYSGKYLSMYNEAANPYLSVSEFWMDNVNNQIAHLKETGYNTMIFDFPLKGVMASAFSTTGSYSNLKNPSNSLRGKGLGKYSVTFIDNHDTFERSDNKGGEFIRYNADLADADVKSRILQANAYILMMPGVPCVFWPHWKTCQSEINALIAARKLAGIHSESAVLSETTSQNNYEAVIQGHRGQVMLRLGSKRSTETPEGYRKVVDGPEHTVYYREGGEGIGQTPSDSPSRGEKVLKDGQLYLKYHGVMYDLQGRRIEN